MLIVFIANFITLVIEIIAGHILAPFVGHSLYTWTSIIGVILGAMSLGAYLGGRLADRIPPKYVLGLILFGAGIVSNLIYPLAASFQRHERWLRPMNAIGELYFRIVILALVFFFLPCVLLGMITPLVTKSLLSDLNSTGKTVGRVSAVGTLGSIFGTFLTGFLLMDWLSTQEILLLSGTILIIAAIFGGHFFSCLRNRPKTAFSLVGLFILSLLVNYVPYRTTALYESNSGYSSIRILNAPSSMDGRRSIRKLYLNRGLHAANDLLDPLHLVFPHLNWIASFLEERKAGEREFRILVIGGGGYTLPIYLQAKYPKMLIDVVEIDVAVTEVAKLYMGFHPAASVRVFDQDARWFALSSERTGYYDLVFNDAFSGLTIPDQLTSLEFIQQVRKMMKPDGVFVTNLIDRWKSGRFWASYLLTSSRVFDTSSLSLVAEVAWFKNDRADNALVFAGGEKADFLSDLKRIQPLLKGDYGRVLGLWPETMGKWIKRRNGVVLTDNYNPSSLMVLSSTVF